jgi:Phosphoribulokinase / Uridine kinase family
VALQGVTALDPVAQDFDLMYEQTKALKEGKPVQKPIYNHVSGKLDPAEEIKAPKVEASAAACMMRRSKTIGELLMRSITALVSCG